MIATALIAEDEAPQRAELRRMLQELWPELSIVAECEDGLSALEALQAHAPDIVFLDIRMPGLNGLALARSACVRGQVVFTTAYDEHAVDAFERGAVDYLLKPIKRDRLALTLQRLRERGAERVDVNLAALLGRLEPLFGAASQRDRIRWITATTGNTTRLFSIDEVIYFKAEEKYTRVVTASDSAYVRMSLKELADSLDSSQFWQIHRSVIVRAAAIRSVHRRDDGKLTLQLKGLNDELPVSHAFASRFKSM